MEQTTANRYAWLLGSTTPEPAHVPTPPLPNLDSQTAAMEAVVAEVYVPTPEPPLPTTPAESLNNSTLVPTQTPEGYVAVPMEGAPPPEALLASPVPQSEASPSPTPVVHSPTPQLITDGARILDDLARADNAASFDQVWPDPPSNPLVGWDQDTPSPDSVFALKASRLLDAWMPQQGFINQKTFNRLRKEYTVNMVGNRHIWELSCWLHRAPVSKVRDFLYLHGPDSGIIHALQHAFATRLTRLRGNIGAHSPHADAVRTALLQYAEKGAIPTPSPSLPSPGPSTIEALRSAVPSPTPIPVEVISVHSTSSDSVVLVTPREQAAIERAMRRVSRTAPIAPPLSRRPSLSLSEASGRPAPPEEDAASDSSLTPTGTPAPQGSADVSMTEGPTPSSHSSIMAERGDHPRVPIIVDTPTDGPYSDETDHTRSPPTDMGHARGDGRMTARRYGGPPTASSSLDVPRWSGDTQEQEAKAIMDALRASAARPRPDKTLLPALTNLPAESTQTARDWADTLNSKRIGYAYYLLNGTIDPVAGGAYEGPDGALMNAFLLATDVLGSGVGPPLDVGSRVVNSNAWFRCAAASLSAITRGVLVSDEFFRLGAFPVKPCPDSIQYHNQLQAPESQVELLQAMTGQLLEELSAKGISRLSRPELWQEIYAQERDHLRQAVRDSEEHAIWQSQLMQDAKRATAEEALAAIIKTFKADEAALKEQTSLAARIATKVGSLRASWEAEFEQGVERERAALKAQWQDDLHRTAMHEAQAEWRTWKETELATARAEAMNRISLDYVLQACGSDAEAMIAAKRDFARDFVAHNYQGWVDQALCERWPEIEQHAQGYTREQYLNEELGRIWPEVREEARKEAEANAAKYRANLEVSLNKTADADHRVDAYVAGLVPRTKAGKQRAKDVKRERTALVEAKRTPAGPTAQEQTITRAVLETAEYENGHPNAMHQLGVAIGVIHPFEETIGVPVGPILPPPSPETIGDRDSSAPPATDPFPALPSSNGPRSVASSMHAPGNQMEDDAPAPEAEPSQDTLIQAVRELLAPLQAGMLMLTSRVEELDRRTRQPRVEHPLPARPASPPPVAAPLPAAEIETTDRDVSMSPPRLPTPTPPSPVGSSEAPLPVDGQSSEQAPAPVDAPPAPSSDPTPPIPKPKRKAKGKGKATVAATGGSEAPAPVPAKDSAKAPTTKAADNDGFISVGRRGPTYNSVTAKGVQQNAATRATASAAAAAQGRTAKGTLRRNAPTSSPTLPTITRIVVVRNGGLTDVDAEARLRITNPGFIVQGVRTAIERQTSNPLRLLGGRWSRGVERTGNFVYHVAGKVAMSAILPFSSYLLQPFPGATLVPAEGWCWAQLRGVLTAGSDDVIYDEDQLTAELRLNPVFETVPLVQVPHWATDPFKISTNTSTVVFAYIDQDKSITQAAVAGGVSMFSYGVKVDPPADPAPAPRAILKRPTEVETPSLARVDDVDPPLDFPLFDAAQLGQEVNPVLHDPTPAEAAANKPAPKAPKPKARIVRPSTDSAKPGETSTERAATRFRPASPSEVQGLLNMAVPKTKADTTLKQVGAATASLAAKPREVRGTSLEDDGVMRPQTVVERLAEMYPSPLTMNIPSSIVEAATTRYRYMVDEVKQGRVTVTVVGRDFIAPFADYCPRFHKLRNAELATLVRIMDGDEAALMEPRYWTAGEYENTALQSRAFGGHDHLGAELAEPMAPTAVPTRNRPVPPYV
ncbi:hypothetical protein EDB86DRAFT_3107947 [Lactarius hatsudake]|nr:hypothetical protein EDB86DRAFT_3107947 [Lactarius hatsudake]